jgi:hypothetical protein
MSDVCVELLSASQILCVSSLLSHVMYICHSLFCGLCSSSYIKYVSGQHLRKVPHKKIEQTHQF